MSRRPSHPGLHGPVAAVRWLVAGCAVVVLLAGGVIPGATVQAQEASPVPVPCDAPALPPGTPTPPMVGSPEATDITAPTAEEPAASPAAGTPADEATTQAATAAAQNIVNCLNSGNYEGTAALFTDHMIMQIAGTTNPYDAVAELAGLVFTDFQTGAVMVSDDGRLSIEVTYLQSQYQFVHERWWLVQDGAYWKLDGFEALAPEPAGDTVVVGVALGAPDNEYSIVPNTEAVTQSEVLIFHATNGGQEAHQLLVLRLPEGADPRGLLDDSLPDDQIEFIGVADGIAPGASQDLALIHLDPGVYTLICFYPAPDGVSHAEHGMVATFTVNAPA